MRGTFFLTLYVLLCPMALANPFYGVVAYLIDYHVAPQGTWWGASLAASGIRFSFTVSVFMVLGTIFRWGHLRYRRLLTGQEILLLLFVGWMVVLRATTGEQVQALGSRDPVEKMLKLSVFLFVLTHVVVTEQALDRLLWILVLCGLYMGYEAYNTPAGDYVDGRLNGGFGGPDFREANSIAVHALLLLALVGVQFLRSGWRGRAVALASGVLLANTIIQTRSRGAMIGMIPAVVLALVGAPKEKRKLIWVFTFIGLVGLFQLIDKGWLARMETVEMSSTQRDASAESRLEVWAATIPMIQAHPLGVGPGNFSAAIGDYSSKYAHRDTHNTYLRCAAELGIPGAALLGLLICNAWRILIRVSRQTFGRPDLQSVRWFGFALTVALGGYLAAATFGSYIYLESLWYLLLLPAALERALENKIEDNEHAVLSALGEAVDTPESQVAGRDSQFLSGSHAIS